MVLALSTAHQIGLATTGALFIIFALVSSFVLPRTDPNFPGQWRNWYLVVCVVFFLAMMSAVIVFGREQAEAHAAETQTTSTSPAQPSGDPVAGKAVFAKYSCHSCHTFTPAGATGKVGPNLDNLKESAAKAGQPLDKFIETSVTDPNAYIAPGYTPAMPKFPLTPKEVDDVVAFLSSGQ